MKETIAYKGSQISYLRFGSGSRRALCFHGYGEKAGSFAFLEKYAGDHFTFFCIDLPFHGDTHWEEGLNFSIDDLVAIINSIPGMHDQQLHKEPVTLIGFSLGGRMVLSLYEKMAFDVDRLVLLAPDGLKVNFWYWLSTQTWVGNKFFAFTMKHPRWFFRFLKLLHKLKLANASIFKFVNFYIGDKEFRRLLYARWTSLRKIKPHLKQIKSLITTQNVQVRLVYGKHDRIILPVRGEKFIQGIEKNSRLTVIHSGHQLLQEKHAAELLPALLH